MKKIKLWFERIFIKTIDYFENIKRKQILAFVSCVTAYHFDVKKSIFLNLSIANVYQPDRFLQL